MSRVVKFYEQIQVEESKTIGKVAPEKEKNQDKGVDSEAVINKIAETYNPQGKLDDFLKDLQE